jgi:phosphate:Na+ symporter
LVGTILTMILQSSSATVGITMALASQGLLNFEASVALILGDNIGTTITAQLAAMGAGLNARRTARAHALFNIFGVIYIVIFFPFFIKLVTGLTATFFQTAPLDLAVGGEYPNIGRYIANSHTIFNVVNAVVFLFALPWLVRTSTWLTPEKKGDAKAGGLHHIKYLDSKYIDTPSVALGQVRAEVFRMGEAVKFMFREVITSVEERKPKELAQWKQREDELDHFQREINQFLAEVIQGNISPEESREVAALMRMANNLERIGDAIENIAELGEELISEDLIFSEEGWHDLKVISSEVQKFIGLVIEGLAREDAEIMPYAQKLEDNINKMREEMRSNYLMRLQSGACTVDPGLILVDMLTAYEKMGDYCYNIAQAVAGIK